jgi:hypothetical protein
MRGKREGAEDGREGREREGEGGRGREREGERKQEKDLASREGEKVDGGR